MYQSNNHIISKVSWDTSFDQREKSGELQQRLSSWSNISMPTEVTNILDKMCPPGQTWIIQSLQLDLGSINYQNLEFELTQKIGGQLREQLLDRIIHLGADDQVLTILDTKSSELDIITCFLINGVMPWNYKSSSGTFNQILAVQLQSNSKETIQLIRSAGVTSENVRKRMSWQIHEPNMVKIIQGLEPNNSTQINEFSTAMVKIQVEKNIVQAGAAEFKKSVWFWILNYLLTERGSVFNRIAFMRSSIVQMAHHYNISYDELLKMIDNAVRSVRAKAVIKANFIVTLNTLLSDGNSTKKDASRISNNQPVLWHEIEHYIKQPEVRRANKTKFAQLLTKALTDPVAFDRLITYAVVPDGLWLSLAKDISITMLERVFTVIGKKRSIMMVETINLIWQLSKNNNLPLGQKALWGLGFKFLNAHKGSVTTQQFTRYCILQLTETGHLTTKHLYVLLRAEPPSSLKTIKILPVYSALKNALIASAFQNGADLIQNDFTGLLHAFAQDAYHLTDRTTLVHIKKALQKKIALNPAQAYRALASYPDKAQLGVFLPLLLDERSSRMLLRESGKETYDLILLLEQLLASAMLVDLLKYSGYNNLMELALHNILFYSPASPPATLTHILKVLFVGMPTNRLLENEKLIRNFVHSGVLSGNSVSIANAVNQICLQLQKQPLVGRVQALITGPIQRRVQVANLLSTHWSDRDFTSLRSAHTSFTVAILNYLIPNGAALFENFVNTHRLVLLPQLGSVSTSNISGQLTDIYWKCILNYRAHADKSEAVKKAFEAAVLFKFPINRRFIRPMFSTMLVEGQFKKNSTALPSSLSLNKMLPVIAPIKLTRVEVTKIAIEGGIDALKSIFSFEEFNLWIAANYCDEVKEAAMALRVLAKLITHFATPNITAKLLDKCWQQSWGFAKANTWQVGALRELISESLLLLSYNTEVDAERAALIMRRHSMYLTPKVKNIFNEYFPGFCDVLLVKKLTNTQVKLEQAERKGVLDELIYQLLVQKQVPLWYGKTSAQGLMVLLNEIIIRYPQKLLQTLRFNQLSDEQLLWLCKSDNFDELLRSIDSTNGANKALLTLIADLYQALYHVRIAGVATGELQLLLFKKIITAYTTGNWAIISMARIWHELLWDACTKRGINQANLIKAIEKVKHRFPRSIQTSFNILAKQITAPKQKVPIQTAPIQHQTDVSAIKDSITVYNAGCVIASGYLTMLFERLGILSAGKFITSTHQANAVHYLQYLITGLTDTDESLLPLNKVLCGLSPAQAVANGITILPEHQELMDGLLLAMISHWPTIGDCSIDGFRGNWFVREGLLCEHDDKWELTVEKRAYDLLINSAPFSFSIIKYPWMDKPLQVNWPY